MAASSCASRRTRRRFHGGRLRPVRPRSVISSNAEGGTRRSPENLPGRRTECTAGAAGRHSRTSGVGRARRFRAGPAAGCGTARRGALRGGAAAGSVMIGARHRGEAGDAKLFFAGGGAAGAASPSGWKAVARRSPAGVRASDCVKKYRDCVTSNRHCSLAHFVSGFVSPGPGHAGQAPEGDSHGGGVRGLACGPRRRQHCRHPRLDETGDWAFPGWDERDAAIHSARSRAGTVTSCAFRDAR